MSLLKCSLIDTLKMHITCKVDTGECPNTLQLTITIKVFIRNVLNMILTYKLRMTYIQIMLISICDVQ